MELKTFFDNFELMAEAPNGIQKLREMILQLAVQGKLVRREDVEGTGHEIYKQLKNSQFQKNGKKRRLKTASLNPDARWDVPDHWAFTTLESSTRGSGVFIDGDWVETKDQDPEGDVRLIQLADVGEGQYRDRSDRFMNSATAERLNCTYLEVGDVLIARMPDPLGRACIFPGDSKPSVTVVDVCILRPNIECFSPNFLTVVINSANFRSLILEKATGTTRSRISRGNLAKLPLPIAPLEEQKRIVAKVDELMALCDDLEARKQNTHQTCIKLNDASIDKLLTAPSPAKFNRHWNRICDNFDLLYSKPENVAKLREAILQLAVQGKLVKQDPNDEPASVLLEKIYRRRCEWIDDAEEGYKEAKTIESKIKRLRKKPIQPPSDKIPENWSWSTVIEACCLVVDCHNKTAPYVDKGIKLVRTSNIRKGQLNFVNVKYVNKSTYEYWSRRCPPLPGDILLTREAPVGEVAIIPENEILCMGQRMMLLRPFHDLMLKEYLLIAIMSPDFLSRLENSQIGATVKHLRVGDVEKAMIAVPSLREQKRIVAKVDQLMALCDELEARLIKGQTKSGRLLETAVKELLAA